MEKGTIIQVTDSTHPWFGVLLIVTEPKSWGCQAVCVVPMSNSENDLSLAYNRLRTGEYEVVGKTEEQLDRW